MILFYPFLFNYWFYKRMEELRVLWRDYFKFREKRVMGAPFLLTWFQKVQQFSIFFPTVLRCLSDLKVSVINQYVIEHTFIWSASVYFSTLTYTKRTFYAFMGETYHHKLYIVLRSRIREYLTQGPAEKFRRQLQQPFTAFFSLFLLRILQNVFREQKY